MVKKANRKFSNAPRKGPEIQLWLKKRGIKQVHLAQDIGVDGALVSRTIHGKENNNRVLTRLRNLGVPKSYFGRRS